MIRSRLHRFLSTRRRPLLLLLTLSCLALGPHHAWAAEPEIRGFWIEAWSNGLKTPAQIDQLMTDVRAGNFNTIIPQVRRRGDTLYFSEIEPRIQDETLPPDFDALAYLIEQARAQEPPIEVHAWIVAYPIWRSQNTPPQSPNHIFNRRPDWLSQNHAGDFWDGVNYQHDPGHPGVQEHLLEVCMELITQYDIDGLHFDYIRLTGNTWGYNPVSVERFQRLYDRTDVPAPTDEQWRQFRRDQITQTLRRIYLSAREVRPDIKISAATITWAPGPSNLSQWYNNTSAYRHVMQDWRGWMEEGILDLNIPMAYFQEHTHPDDWMKWITFAKDHRYERHVAIGPGLWLNSIANTVKQMRDTRAPSPAGNVGQGVVGFSFQGTNNEGLPHSELLQALTQPGAHDPILPPLFAEPAPVPEMPWLSAPSTGHLKGLVRDGDSGLPSDGAIVHLSGQAERSIQADANGFYGFVDLPPGEYTVVAYWDGDETPARTVTFAAGEVAHQDLYFGPSPEHAPAILAPPQAQRVIEGSRVVLAVEASGLPEPQYQWQFQETDLAGARDPLLILDPVNMNEAGDYRVVVSNFLGSVVSEPAPLTIEPIPPQPQFTVAGPGATEIFEAELIGNPNTWFLVETSPDLLSWLPLTVLEITNRPVHLRDPDWSLLPRRFYRARATATALLGDFNRYANGSSVMFRQPSYSGSTNSHIETGDGLPNFSTITSHFPAGISASRVLHSSWSFRGDTTDPWLRLTTHQMPTLPNPIVDFSQGIRFIAYADRPVYLALGLRETDATGAIGEDGGISGDIEWVGGRADNTARPPRGMLVPAGEWTPVHFFLPHEPVQGHTGNGILESSTGKGVLENVTVVPADGPGVYNLFLDGIRTVELGP